MVNKHLSRCPRCNSTRLKINLEGDLQCQKCRYVNLSIESINKELRNGRN